MVWEKSDKQMGPKEVVQFVAVAASLLRHRAARRSRKGKAKGKLQKAKGKSEKPC